MASIPLDVVKRYCWVTHDEDDGKLLLLLEAAEQAAVLYLGWYSLTRRRPPCPADSSESSESSSSEEAVPSLVEMAVCAFVQAQYDQEGEDAARAAFERALFPLRIDLGF